MLHLWVEGYVGTCSGDRKRWRSILRKFWIFKPKCSVLKQLVKDSSPVRLSRTRRHTCWASSKWRGGRPCPPSPVLSPLGCGPIATVTAFASGSAKVFHHLIHHMLRAFFISLFFCIFEKDIHFCLHLKNQSRETCKNNHPCGCHFIDEHCVLLYEQMYSLVVQEEKIYRRLHSCRTDCAAQELTFLWCPVRVPHVKGRFNRRLSPPPLGHLQTVGRRSVVVGGQRWS